MREKAVKAQMAYLAEFFQAPSLAQPTYHSDEDDTEIEFSYFMAQLMEDCPKMEKDEVLVYAVNKKTGKTKKMIEKSIDALTANEIREHWPEVEAAYRKECKSFKDNGTYEVALRKECDNICSSKWVVRWKLVDNVRVVKARLTIRGFQDLQSNLNTFSSTASRWGQRLICSVAVQHAWVLLVADVATAFLQGMTFKEISAMSNTEMRDVAFAPPLNSECYFVELEKGLYVPLRDVLRL